MSLLRRSRSASVASASSSRLRCRITCSDCSGFAQKLGSKVFFSSSASCSRTPGASKVLPKVVDLGFDGGVFAFEFFDHKSSCQSSVASCQFALKGRGFSRAVPGLFILLIPRGFSPEESASKSRRSERHPPRKHHRQQRNYRTP